VQFQRLTADATGHRRARVDDPLAFVSGASFTGEGDRMDDELIALAPNVWLLPCDDDADAGRVQPAVGIVCSATQTVLVDAGNGPAHARRIRAALDRIAAPPLRCVIYTHHHPDHVFGAQLFGVPAIAHELGRALVAELAARSWSREALARRIAEEPERAVGLTALRNAVGDDQVTPCVPALTFSQRLRLHMDGLTVELRHVGGQHAPDSIVVGVPEAGVLFLGDCFYPPPLHLRAPDSTLDVAMLAGLVSEQYEWYVEGHGAPHRRAALRAALAAFERGDTG
jgi:glyoxylase-like metal-dependent hydrolase (beta-lactamase superfamily II)